MDSMGAFLRGRMAAASKARARVFDWDKAAQVLRERGATSASAGLSEDWGWTGGLILHEGEPVPHEETYVYLSSTWATPILRIDDADGGSYEVDCWRYEDEIPDADSGTYWPESALKILRAKP